MSNAESASTVAMPTKASKKGMPSTAKLLVVGILVFVLFVLVVLIGGTALAFTSNKNIPVFSEVVESIEKLALSEDAEAEIVQDDVNDIVFTALASLVESEDMLGGTIDAQYSKDEALSYIKGEEWGLDSANYKMNISLNSKEDDVKMSIDSDGFFTKDGLEGDMRAEIASQGINLEVAMDMKAVEDSMYMKINEAPFEVLGITDSSAIKGQWFSVSPEDLEQAGGVVSSLGAPQASSLPATSIITKSDLDKIQEFIYSKEVADTIKRVDDKLVDGVRTNCFEVTLNEENMPELAAKIGELSGENIEKEDVASSMEDMGDIVVGACMGRRDGHIYEITMDFEIPGDDGADGVDLGMTIELSDFNNVDKKIDLPSDSNKLMDMLQMMMSDPSVTPDEVTDTSDTPDFENMSDEELQEYLENYDY